MVINRLKYSLMREGKLLVFFIGSHYILLTGRFQNVSAGNTFLFHLRALCHVT